MPRQPVKFKEVDIKRAVKATQKAGVSVLRVEVDPKTGKIVVIAKGQEPGETGVDTWEDVG